MAPSVATYPFQLNRLSLNHILYAPFPTSLLQSSIASLSLRWAPGTRSLEPTYVLALSNIAHQLISLSVSHSFPATFLKPFFERCTNLANFQCDTVLGRGVLEFLPGALREWIPMELTPIGVPLEPVRASLVSGSTAVSALRKLRLGLNQ